jgi:hypothetical protein
MPPRCVTLAIVACWLGTTGWLAYREVWPRLRGGEPPPVTIDLTDDLSLSDAAGIDHQANKLAARTVSWKVELQGKQIGYAMTTVLRRKDRTFDLMSRIDFAEADENDTSLKKKLKLPFKIEVSSVTCSYHVTRAGALRGLTVMVTLKDVGGFVPLGPKGSEYKVGVDGEVEDGQLVPRAVLFEPDTVRRGPRDNLVKKELPIKLQPVPVPERGTVLNTLQPVNRLTGLRAGQTWSVPRVDPLEYVMAAFRLGGRPRARYLDAAVATGTLSWDRQEVPCWRIDYSAPGQKVSARTWVRRRDGLVLMQEAHHQGLSLVLRREPRK